MGKGKMDDAAAERISKARGKDDEFARRAAIAAQNNKEENVKKAESKGRWCQAILTLLEKGGRREPGGAKQVTNVLQAGGKHTRNNKGKGTVWRWDKGAIRPSLRFWFSNTCCACIF